MPKENIIPFPLEKTTTQLYKKSLDQQVQHLMSLPAEDRIKAISESPDPEALVQKLPEQDFYISVKEVDVKDALVLVRNASPSQLKFLFDMEWWEKYVPEEEKAWEWLEFLRTNAPRQLLTWLKNVDGELLISLLKKWLVLEKVPDPDETDFMEATDKLPPYTIDNVYYWNAKKGDKLPLIKTILATLFELDQKLYFQVMEGIIWGIQAELEEDAYKWRKGRLEDLAIPDFYDALDIYKEIDLSDFFEKHYVDKKDINLQTTELVPAIYPLVLLPGKSPLAKAVEHIRDPDLLDFLKVELAALANKVVIADQLSLGEPESLKKAVEKVVGYVQLGLDQVSKNTIEEVIELLKSFPLESIFRLGFTLVKRLKIRAKKIVTEGWISKWPHKMLILPTPYQSLLESLMLPDPQCLEISQDGTLEIKAFSSLDKILWTGDKLSEIECLGDIYWGLDVDYVKIVEKLWPLGQPGEPTEIKIDDLIITAVANKIITGKIEYLPIPSPRIPEVIRTVQQSSEDSLVDDFMSEFHFSSAESQESNTFYVKELLAQFKENIADIKEPEKIDLRYIQGILIEK